jgi:pimeloyl-ACP methyl ester carboxylesterase
VGIYARDAQLVEVEGGRVLEVELIGPPDGAPVFLHHGTPGASGLFQTLAEAGAERNVRHISYSRPGYSGSGRLAGRTVASCVEDVAAIADWLGYERFHSYGGSGGAPHAIACAALLPSRVISAAVIACPAPFDAVGLDWAAGMGSENLEEIAAARGGADELEAYLEGVAPAMANADGDEIVAVLGDLVCEADRRALTTSYGAYLAAQYARSLSAGVGGWMDDDIALFSPWGFDLEKISVPVTIWHGVEDRFVPVAHGEWLAAHLDAKARIAPGDGHLSLLITAYGDVLDDLLNANGHGSAGG